MNILGTFASIPDDLCQTAFWKNVKHQDNHVLIGTMLEKHLSKNGQKNQSKNGPRCYLKNFVHNILA